MCSLIEWLTSLGSSEVVTELLLSQFSWPAWIGIWCRLHCVPEPELPLQTYCNGLLSSHLYFLLPAANQVSPSNANDLLGRSGLKVSLITFLLNKQWKNLPQFYLHIYHSLNKIDWTARGNISLTDMDEHVWPCALEYGTSKIIPVLDRWDILALTDVKCSWSTRYEGFIPMVGNSKLLQSERINAILTSRKTVPFWNLWPAYSQCVSVELCMFYHDYCTSSKQFSCTYIQQENTKLISRPASFRLPIFWKALRRGTCC